MDTNVSQFVAITGATSDIAKRLLEACGGNLDLAINMHLESGGSAGPSSGMETANNVLSSKSYEELYGDTCVYRVCASESSIACTCEQAVPDQC